MKKNKYSLEDFLKFNYKFIVTPFADDDELEEEGYVITCPELNGVKVFGCTIEEVLEEFHEAKIAWFEMKEKLGEEILPPVQITEKPSGRLTARFPIDLHQRLIDYSVENKVSMNTSLINLLNLGLERENKNDLINKISKELKKIDEKVSSHKLELKFIDDYVPEPFSPFKSGWRKDIFDFDEYKPTRDFSFEVKQ